MKMVHRTAELHTKVNCLPLQMKTYVYVLSHHYYVPLIKYSIISVLLFTTLSSANTNKSANIHCVLNHFKYINEHIFSYCINLL